MCAAYDLLTLSSLMVYFGGLLRVQSMCLWDTQYYLSTSLTNGKNTSATLRKSAIYTAEITITSSTFSGNNSGFSKVYWVPISNLQATYANIKLTLTDILSNWCLLALPVFE